MRKTGIAGVPLKNRSKKKSLITVTDIKAPGLPGSRGIYGIPKKPLPSSNKPGTNKPLLTSFQTIKTNNTPPPYRDIFSAQTRAGRLSSALGKLAVVLAVSLLSPYIPPTLNLVINNDGLASKFSASAYGDSQIDIWWPIDQAVLSGSQPFKALANSKGINEYKMYWQVDNGQKNEMPTSYTDYPHKEFMVDLSGWNWKGNGPYTLTFSAVDSNGQKFAERSRVIYINKAPESVATPSNQPIAQQQAAQSPSSPLPGGSCPAPGNNSFIGCYYSDRNFGNLKLVRTDPILNFDWGGGSPGFGMPVDRFSVRWQGNYSFEQGEYKFTTTADDGVRVFVDGGLVIDQWKDQPATAYTSTKDLSAGSHTVKMEYYENGGGAVAKLLWARSSASADSTAPISAQLASYSSNGSSLAGVKLYIDPNSNAKRQADSWRASRPQDAEMMDKIASQPAATWLGGWNGDIKGDVNKLVSAAAGQNAAAVMIAYNIPYRDCGGYSAGGTNPDSYRAWIKNLAAGIGNRKAAVILEPDAITLTECLSAEQLKTRQDLLKEAISVLKGLGKTSVYLDAGHAKWHSADEMASRLKAAGVDRADGFALNTSNFVTTQDNLAYGQAISGKVNGKHFLIDTSRNGKGPTPDMQWCNPAGRALGQKPTTSTGNSLVDAYIWGKQPGESDGSCNGGPSAGAWWPEYALGLAQRASW